MTSHIETAESAVSCPSGHGGKVVKNGRRSGHQRYMCKSCGRHFRELDTPQRDQRYTDLQIGAELHWYFDGLSYRETARRVVREFGIETPDVASVHRWVQRYSRVVAGALVDYRANTGREWVVDEGKVEIGSAPFWLWNVMDRDTRYLLISHLTTDNDVHRAAVVLGKAKAAAVDPPEVVCINALRSVVMAMLSVYEIGEVKYTASWSTGEEINKTLSQTSPRATRRLEEMLRSMRTLKTAQNFLDGWRIDYNLFRHHEGLGGRTPAPAAGIEVPFSNWLDIVRMVEPIS